jgi:tripartite-type tricarboxylate transporter receptor subunit TctC
VKGKKAFKLVSTLLAMVLVVGLISGCSTKKEDPKAPAPTFPTKDLSGYIMWGAGGATDNVARSLTPYVEKHLGKTIVLQNMTGATGAVATQHVFDQKADGYTLLYGAENPQLYGVLDISKLDYKDFEPINIIARGVAIVVVPADSKWNTIQEVIADAKQRPGDIQMGSTGPGGLPFVVASLLKTVSGVEFNMVPFDGEGPSMTAMLGGHVDITIAGLTAAREMYRAGRVKPLAVISIDPIPGLEEIVPIAQIMPEYKPYLPWGPFYGIFVKKDTPKEVVDALVVAFKKGFDEPEFQKFILDFGAVPMGISGAEAREFLTNWQKISTWLLYDAGGAQISPDTLGIGRIK